MHRPDDPDELVAELANLLSKSRVSDDVLGAVVEGLRAEPPSGTPAECDLANRLRETLTTVEWESLPALLRGAREGRRVETIGGEPFRRAREQALAEQQAAGAERERAEAEAQAAAARKAGERETAIRELNEVLEHRFLECDEFYQSRLCDRLHEDEFNEQKLAFVRSWILRNAEWRPDEEQLAAVAATGQDILVSARAGSGKTSVLVHRALFLMGHCGVRGDSILLLAFNRRAAQEIRDRISLALNGGSSAAAGSPRHKTERPHVSTFHALAYAIVRPTGRLLTDDQLDSRPVRSALLQGEIDLLCRDPRFLQRVWAILDAVFRADLEDASSLGLSTTQKIEQARSNRSMALDGTWVRSYGEKVIANFLFEHGLRYWYERAVLWGGRPYRPDFTIDLQGGSTLVIEYFGLNDDAYSMERQKKRTWLREKGWPLIEVEPSDIGGRARTEIETALRERLEPHLPPFERLSPDEVWERCAKDRLLDFTKSLMEFIGRCRQSRLSPDDLRRLPQSAPWSNPILAAYYDIAADAYSAYLSRLEELGDDDFSGLLQRACERIQSGATDFERNEGRGVDRQTRSGQVTQFTHVLVDEFQDCAPLFNDLVQSIRAKSGASQFSVGDDWQAINGFAGSDLRFFDDYEDQIAPVIRLDTASNYRSRPEVVETGNRLMVGLGTPSRPTRGPGGVIQVWDISRMAAVFGFEREVLGGDPRVVAALRLALHALARNERVHVLTRTNIKALEEQINLLPKTLRERLSTSTTHKYKGRESPAVVVMDVHDGAYPLIHPFWIFGQLLGDSIPSIEAAERRLLYVALTRAVDEMHVVVDDTRPSPFIPWGAGFPWTKGRLDELPRVETTAYPGMHVLVTVKEGNSKEIKESLKSAGFRWDHPRYRWAGFTRGPAPSLADLARAPWAKRARGVTVTIHTDPSVEATITAGEARQLHSPWSLG